MLYFLDLLFNFRFIVLFLFILINNHFFEK